ncbi:hypothetical protein PJ900_21950 [Tistrella mobilis]|uniref:hypothetical protein n=1 Tax=Tistrella mobilis TaxID=171437 RepID=UPI0012E7DD43|nr:hypothetical protein [Tistrella mobilis]
MINDLFPETNDSKRADIVQRLNNKRVDQCIPAEIELSILWMLKDLDDFEVEPHWWPGGKKPDVYVGELIPRRSSVIEITSVSDVSTSGEDVMDRCATAIMKIADKYKRGSGNFLDFFFGESRVYNGSYTVREICAPSSYSPSRDVDEQIREWITSNNSDKAPLILRDQGLVVRVKKIPYKSPRYSNIRASRPPRIYSETNNPIYSTLSKKLEQIVHAPAGVCRFIFLAEVGSKVLMSLHHENSREGEIYFTAEDIIWRFLSDKRGKIEGVAVILPINGYEFAGRPYVLNKFWKIVLFCEDECMEKKLLRNLNWLIKKLPAPRLSGHNARSLTRQHAMTHNSKLPYLSSFICSNKIEGKRSYKVSSRLLMDFLCKRISENEFRDRGLNDQAQIFLENLRSKGCTISSINLSKSGLDEDDDLIEFNFEEDPAASKFK